MVTKRNMTRAMLLLGVRLGIALEVGRHVLGALTPYGVRPARGKSMAPACGSPTLLIVKRRPPGHHDDGARPLEGAMVGLQAPLNDKMWGKRLIAASGMDADVAGRSVTARCALEPGEGVRPLPRGTIWVEGDNRAASLDSRYVGPVPVGLLREHVVSVARRARAQGPAEHIVIVPS